MRGQKYEESIGGPKIKVGRETWFSRKQRKSKTELPRPGGFTPESETRGRAWVDVAVHLAGARWLALDGLGCKKIAAPQFHTWSPTVSLNGLTIVDRTGNSMSHLAWQQSISSDFVYYMSTLMNYRLYGKILIMGQNYSILSKKIIQGSWILAESRFMAKKRILLPIWKL